MPKARPDSLTASQWDDVRAIRGEYVAASLCTAPADQAATETAICRMYELAGYDPPRLFWFQSPAAIRVMIWLMRPDRPSYNEPNETYESPEFRLRMRNVPEDWLHHPLSAAHVLGAELHRELRLVLDGPPRIPARLHAASSSVAHRPQVYLDRPRVRDDLTRAAKQTVGAIGCGVIALERLTPDAPTYRSAFRLLCDNPLEGLSRSGGQFHNWIAEYDVLRRLGLVTYNDQDNERLDLLCALTRSCGWWEPYQTVCFVTERPAVVRVEPQGDSGQLRLHCPDGPAITFRDDWSVHAWHGTTVPATLVEEGWDIEAIMDEPNAEIRRCAIEKLGWDVFERHLIPIATAPDPGNPGQVLSLCDLPGARRNATSRYWSRPAPERLRMLLCSNGTPEPDGTRRRFALQVPPHHTDPVAAAAELYGWTRRQYARLARRA